MTIVHDKFFNPTFLKQALDNPKLLKDDPDWLLHSIPFIVSVIPDKPEGDKISLDNYYKKIGRVESIWVDKKEYSGDVIRLIFKILGSANRSDILPNKLKQTQKTLYSSAVPWVLYAWKHTYNTSYDNWEFDNEDMSDMVLGPALSNYFGIKDYLENINETALQVLSEAGEIGVQEYKDKIGKSNLDTTIYHPFDPKQRREWRREILSDYAFRPTEFAKLKALYKLSHRLGYTHINKFWWCMLTQTWIFDPSIRSPDMVTSFVSLGTIDPPLEEQTVVEVISDLKW